MSYFTYLNSAKAGNRNLDYAITDLQILDHNGSTYLISASRATDGGIVSYLVNSNGTLAKVGRAFAGIEGLSGAGPNLMAAQNGQLYLAGTSPGEVLSYSLNNTGSILSPSTLSGIPNGRPLLPVIASAGDFLALGTPRENGFAVYTANGDALSNRAYVNDIYRSNIANPIAISGVTLGGNDFFVVASQSEQGLSVYQVGSGAPRLRETIGVRNGVPMMTPTTMAMAEANGKTYVIVGSAPTAGESGALSVFEMDENGSLSLTDHLQDTRDTRFGRPQAIDSFEINGRTYIAAAGGDNGLSIFGISGDGRLMHLDSIEDTTEMGIGGVTALEFVRRNQSLFLYAAAQTEEGISGFVIDQQNPGLTLYGQDTADVLTGSSDSDWLFGAGGNDELTSGSGNDILSDGAGVDVMTGGAGADLFVLSNDDQADSITDFNPRQDKIDLSGWAYLQSTGDLSITAYQDGYRIRYRNETLYITAPAGVRLNPDIIRDAIVISGNRIWEPPSVDLSGTDGDDTLTGTWGVDTLSGGAGDDTLDGGDGDDILTGGDGNDTLDGGDGDDHISGGPGTDTVILDIDYDERTYVFIEGKTVTIGSPDGLDVFEDIEIFQFNDRKIAIQKLSAPATQGSAYDDVIVGTQAPDKIYGNGGNDILKGLDMSDIIYGGNGDDEIYGGRHGDAIYGQNGNDFVHGNEGDDVIYGGAGQDVLRGGSRNDRLFGEDGNDTLLGNNFSDFLDGGDGNDILKGGGGHDTLTGGKGDDYLKGGKNVDTFIFKKGDGMDRIRDFNPNQDFLDLADNIWDGGKIREIATVTDDGVLLSFSARDSLLLMGLTSLKGIDDSIL